MYFHIYNRGNRKQDIFNDDADRIRFLFIILLFQFDAVIPKIKNILRDITCTEDLSKLIVQPWRLTMSSKRLVKIHTFCLMPNHFHLGIEELKPDSRSYYIMRVIDSYTKYFNHKYKLVGHVFQGSYKSKVISDENYLSALLEYIHNNPKKLDLEYGDLSLFPWSSYTDHIHKNRWGIFLDTSAVQPWRLNDLC